MISTRPTSSPRLLAAVVAVLLLAAATRIINVSTWPVWTDEGWTIWATSDHNFMTVVERLENDRHPPAYFLALSAWRTLTGDSRLAMRFLSILGGMLTVALTYRIGKDWFGHRSAWIAALLLSILSLPVYFSQEVRNYGWLTLSVVLMTFFFLRYIHRPRLRWLILYGLSVAFMLYVQYIGIFVLAVQVAFGLILWRAALKQKLLLIGAVIGAWVLYIPWIPYMILHLFGNVGGGGFNNSVGLYRSTLDNLIKLPNLLFDGQIVVLGSAYLLGLRASLSTGVAHRREQVYVILGGAGLFGALYIFNLKIGIFMPRTLVDLIPALVLICAYGFTQITSAQLRGLLLAVLTVVILGNMPITQPRIAADAIAQQVVKDSTPNDLVILEMNWDDYPMIYELGLAGAHFRIFEPYLPIASSDPHYRPVYQNPSRLMDQYQRVWVLNWMIPSHATPTIVNSPEGFKPAINENISIGSQYNNFFPDSNVSFILYERANGGTPRQFGDLFTLHNAIFDTGVQQGQSTPVDLWWSASAFLDRDYSVGVYLLDSGGSVRVQNDASPASTPTTKWQVNQLMFDRHWLQIPADLPPGTYPLVVKVYWYGDNQPLPVDGQPYLTLGKINVQAAS